MSLLQRLCQNPLSRSRCRRRGIQQFSGQTQEVERLENRSLLVGNVSVVITNGSLVLKGDSGSNQLVVSSGTSAGSVRITGLSNTRINGSSTPLVLQGFRAGINAQLEGGSDFLLVTKLAISGSVVGNLGSGAQNQLMIMSSRGAYDLGVQHGRGIIDDTDQISDPATAITARDVATQGTTRFDQSFGKYVTEAQTKVGFGAVTLSGGVNVVGGAGSDRVSLFDTQVGGGVQFSGGDQNDYFVSQGTSSARNRIAGTLTLALGADYNGVLIDNLTVTGKLSVTTTAPAYGSLVFVGNAQLGDVDINSLADFNAIELSGHRFQTAGVLKADQIKITTGRGSDYLLASGVQATDLILQAANGFAGVTVDDFAIENQLSINTGSYADEIQIGNETGNTLSRAGKLTLSTGEGADQLTIRNVSATAASLITGGGADRISIANSKANTFTSQLGAGADVFQMENVQTFKTTGVSGGADSATIYTMAGVVLNGITQSGVIPGAEPRAQIISGVLVITATPADDRVFVSQVGNQLVVEANGERIAQVPSGSVSEVKASGGDGDDHIQVSPSFRIPAVIRGDAGDDELVGGSGADNISGGAGEDYILGNAGNDTLVGGDGNDQISGDDGDDRIFGGAHQDSLVGGHGNDQISGESGNDTILGGSGNDTINGGDDDDLISGQTDIDNINGNGGSNHIVVEPIDPIRPGKNDFVTQVGKGPVRRPLNPLYNSEADNGVVYDVSEVQRQVIEHSRQTFDTFLDAVVTGVQQAREALDKINEVATKIWERDILGLGNMAWRMGLEKLGVPSPPDATTELENWLLNLNKRYAREIVPTPSGIVINSSQTNQNVSRPTAGVVYYFVITATDPTTRNVYPNSGYAPGYKTLEEAQSEGERERRSYELLGFKNVRLQIVPRDWPRDEDGTFNLFYSTTI
jgi:Ca2+-binding RTX toxin-like protein